ncbi:MAG: hypothetical protein K2K19_07915, partial [Acetatifactor sp.]|nr:hypothetical protein [Acetatifactor sp.]
MLYVVIGAQILGIVIILAAIRLLLSGSGSREHLLMGYFLCGSLVQNVGYLMELTAPSREVAIAAIKVE